MSTCPCCGAPLSSSAGVVVSLDTNSISVGWMDGEPVRLPAQIAELALILSGAMPRVVTNDEIVRRIWGVRETEDAVNHVKVLVSKLRPSIAPLGLRVKVSWGRGYRMVAEQTFAQAAE